MADTTKMNPDYVGYSVKYEDLAYFKEKQDALNDKKVSDALTTAEGYTDTEVGKVAAKVDTLIGDDTNKSVRTIANEELAAQLIPEGAKEALDTLQEIAAWIQAHPDDASAMNKAIEDLGKLVGTLPEGITATTVVGYVAELVAAEKSRAEGIESGLDGRVEALEEAVGTTGSIANAIEAAKNAAIEASNGYTDTEIAALSAEGGAIKVVADDLAAYKTATNARLDALEGAIPKAAIDALFA